MDSSGAERKFKTNIANGLELEKIETDYRKRREVLDQINKYKVSRANGNSKD